MIAGRDGGGRPASQSFRGRHAWQYIDWHFDGADIILVSRTAFDDGLGGAHRAHDAHYLTFHRFARP